MNLPVTFVIACAPHHAAIVEEAVSSIKAQTIPSACIVVYDNDCRGPAWARNRGLERVGTDFVVWLDSDDIVEPDYVEACLRAYNGRRYIFTDWLEDGQLRKAPDCAWDYSTGKLSHHIVTALVPTIAARYIGGFDETFIHGSEDSEFYLHLTRSGICGKRLAKPLVHYRDGGQRSQEFVFNNGKTYGAGKHFDQVMTTLVQRYKDKQMACTDCGGNELDIHQDFIIGEQLPGDVLTEALWKGERPERGPVTRRIYRGGWNSKMWVAPQDVDAAPHLFARVLELPDALEDDDFAALAAFARGGMVAPGRPAPRPLAVQAQPAEVKADVGNVLRLYGQKQQSAV